MNLYFKTSRTRRGSSTGFFCLRLSLVLFILPVLLVLVNLGCNSSQQAGYKGPEYPVSFKLTKSTLQDKIRGGWAGQVIGCTYGGPTEFRYQGTMIQDYIPIVWDSTRIEWYYDNQPGLYDDIYMDLTFVDVMEREGIDAPPSSHALAFANAEYALWHANQVARYNILRGIMPPASGHWENNPHADDIDFQIEADFAGLMSPGMVNPSTEVCDRVGHIMNYGDGWYGGVYVAAMYSLAFYSDDLELIVNEALKTIPEESQFYKCIRDVIDWCGQYPEDWKRVWFEAEKKWSSDIGCPNGVFHAYNIDAKINAAYIVIGLLFGEGDFGQTLEISTRCGQDSDCNPASAGGILGTVLGYHQIPDEWKQGIQKVENRNFRYTEISLNKTYEMSFRHAQEMIRRNGGQVEESAVQILLEEPEPVALEVAFEGHYPYASIQAGHRGLLLESDGELSYRTEFEGKGFVLKGGPRKLDNTLQDAVLQLEIRIDGEVYEVASLPTARHDRKLELTWKYGMEEGPHTLEIKWLNPIEGYGIMVDRTMVYASPKS